MEGGHFTSAEIVTNVDYQGRKTMSENSVFSGGEERHSPTSRPKQRLCFNCKHPIFPEYYFCPECGTSLTDKKSAPETIAPKATIPNAGLKSTRADAASESAVAKDLSKSTIKDIAAISTIPDAASKATIPNVASKSTMPDAGLKSTPADIAPESAVADVTIIPDTVAPEDNISRRTVRPGKRLYCTLTLIPDEKEPISAAVLSFSGEKIILNRANTEPGNITITSKEQGLLSCENKRWFIEDLSELKTTYLYVSEKTELKSGDIIVLGDRRFLFNG
jgi:uncharacterized Zn finger protein (UPF0148 family)